MEPEEIDAILYEVRVRCHQRSRNHVEFIGDFEYFTNDAGELYRARRGEVARNHGQRPGVWQCPPHMIEDWLKTAREVAAKEQEQTS
jgi:hypothetical protein